MLDICSKSVTTGLTEIGQFVRCVLDTQRVTRSFAQLESVGTGEGVTGWNTNRESINTVRATESDESLTLAFAGLAENVLVVPNIPTRR